MTRNEIEAIVDGYGKTVGENLYDALRDGKLDAKDVNVIDFFTETARECIVDLEECKNYSPTWDHLLDPAEALVDASREYFDCLLVEQLGM